MGKYGDSIVIAAQHWN